MKKLVYIVLFLTALIIAIRIGFAVAYAIETYSDQTHISNLQSLQAQNKELKRQVKVFKDRERF